MFLFFVIILIIVLFILLIAYTSYVSSLTSKPTGEISRESAGTYHGSSMFKLVDGIPGWGKGVLVIKADLWDDGITFHKSSVGNHDNITLLYSQITSTQFYTEEEILEKSKSVIGRATAGAFLFGPLGAIIGGMSGVGTKTEKNQKYYYTICFTKSDNSDGMITLDTSCSGCKRLYFDKMLQKLMNTTNKPEFL